MSGVSKGGRYPDELRERAVRMVVEISGQHDSEWAAISEVARLLGVGLPRRCANGCARPKSNRRPYTVDGFKLGKWVAKLETNTRSRGPSRDVR